MGIKWDSRLVCGGANGKWLLDSKYITILLWQYKPKRSYVNTMCYEQLDPIHGKTLDIEVCIMGWALQIQWVYRLMSNCPHPGVFRGEICNTCGWGVE